VFRVRDRHPSDGEIEQYALGILPGADIASFEQHVLICEDCQNRVAAMDADVQAMQAAAKTFRAEEESSGAT